MTDREQILTALADSPAAPRPDPTPNSLSNPDLWERFASEFRMLGGEVVVAASQRLAGRKVSADQDCLSYVDHKDAQLVDVWEAEIGVTRADFAIAETGSIVVSASTERARLTSLAPPIHLALVQRKDIVATLEEATQRLNSKTSVIITGTSRTADIEGILVRGIHGPREVWLQILD